MLQLSLDAWDQLLNFESRDLVEKSFKRRHSIKPNAEKCKEIASCFIQGREFFNNTKEADFSVKPLLLYYGILSITKGLVLFLKANSRECSLKKAHGLQVINWGDHLNSKEFENLRLQITSGTFNELLNATNNTCFFRAMSSGVNAQTQFPIPTNSQEFGFKDVLRCFVDLEGQFEAFHGEPLVHATFNSIHYPEEGKAFYSVGGNLDQSKIDILFPNEKFQGKTNNISSSGASILLSKGVHINLTQKFRGAMDMIGHCHVVQLFDDEIYLNDISKYFASAYVIGMLCRYYPTTWMSLKRGEKGDRMYPYIINLIKQIESYYPVMVLDFLNLNFQNNNENSNPTF